jgi:hypothetical protein
MKPPKLKAKELIDKFEKLVATEYLFDNEPVFDYQKHCALICVSEILDLLSQDINPLVNYWFEVKTEIEKL